MRSGTLHIGMDDTDSLGGMCTTYLAYQVVGRLRRSCDVIDYPRLVRLNPNIPWKTRGNGAVAVTVKTDCPDEVKEMVIDMVRRHSDVEGGANPGVAFLEGDVPESLREFAELALWRLVRRGMAREFAVRHGIGTYLLGNGQGLVGAMGAIGYGFGDTTVELLAYRRPGMTGRPRQIDENSVREMQRHHPDTFSSCDESGKMLIAPRGPDPVLYGVRGESAKAVYAASQEISCEAPAGHMIFRSNQGTGDHLRHEIPRGLAPYTSGIIHGTVSDRPQVCRGGHVFFGVSCRGATVNCAVYKSTKLAGVARGLVSGDTVRIAGGVRPAGRGHGRVLNVEYIDIVALRDLAANPRCGCGKSMKSMGRGQGFRCARCKTVNSAPDICPRHPARRHNIAAVSAHRHLSRPACRQGRRNTAISFDESVPWYVGSGE